VSSCAADVPGTKSTVIAPLVTQNRQVGLKNLHLIDPSPSPYWASIKFYPRASTDIFRFGGFPRGWSLTLLLPKNLPLAEVRATGLKAAPLPAAALAGIRKQLGDRVELFDLKQVLAASSPGAGCAVSGLPVVKDGVPIALGFAAGRLALGGKVQLVQEAVNQRLLGGNTFVFPAGPSRG
jgi:hypothetical protein